MVTKEQFFNGMISYADNEVIPFLPTSAKWGLGALAVIVRKRYDKLLDEISSNAIVRSLDIINENGLIDIDTLYEALKSSSSKYGKMQITFPVIGTLTFSESDIDSLKNYIVGGNIQ